MTGKASLDVSTLARPSTAPHSATPSTARPENLGQSRVRSNSQEATHQRFVLTDPVAFSYLLEDPSTTVLERRRELQGYECYVVEQWATSRTHPTFAITTYTGDPSHIVVVGVLSVLTDESAWSPRLRVYFKALNQSHARRRETALGVLMVTNLSGFPSSLTVIPVPDGDLKKHRFDFFVNENLKRLGCSGRVGLTLTPPSAATVAKFHQLYRTSDKNALYSSVIELVKLCQAALNVFAKLEIVYVDGLLCDVTEKAVNDWWVETGSEYYSIEPHDGILGPTTVAALLGLLMGARNRLHAVNAPVGKDAFDVESMKRGISTFQKQQRIQSRSRRLDRKTLDRLHRATAKAASSDGWTVPRAVKSTVAELSGKGGERVMDVVGRRDKAGIAEIETPDMERFVQLVYGERCKWLWYGKPMKKTKCDLGDRLQGDVAEGKELVFRSDEHGGFQWAGRRAHVGMPADRRPTLYEEGPMTPALEEHEESEEDPMLIKSVMKRATGLKHDANRGFGKFKDAVSFRGLQSKHLKDNSPLPPIEGSGSGDKMRLPVQSAQSTPVRSPQSPRSPVTEKSLQGAIEREESSMEFPREDYTAVVTGTPERSETHLPAKAPGSKDLSGNSGKVQSAESDPGEESGSGIATAEPSIAGSIYNGVDLNELLPSADDAVHDIGPLLRRTLSASHLLDTNLRDRSDDFYPRHLSFSLAEDSILTRPSLTNDDISPPTGTDSRKALADQEALATTSKALRAAIYTLSTSTASWTSTQLHILTGLLTQADRDQQVLDALYYPHFNSVQRLQTSTERMVREHKERLEEGGKEIETLANKLEYEIDGLRARVQDVEMGVREFEGGVRRVEGRVGELEKEKRNSGVGCVVC